MAGWLEDGLWGRGLLMVGTGVVVSGATYLLWRFFNQNYCPSKDTSNGHVSRVHSDSHDNKVLVLGLDGSGKSSILAALSNQDTNDEIKPTQGFNVMCVQTNDVSLNIWEIGGTQGMRKYWSNFIPDAGVLVFVIDSSDHTRFYEATAELRKLLEDNRVKRLPLVIVANKQDLPGSEASKSMYLELLNELGRLPSVASVQGTSTQVPPNGGAEGLDMLQTILIDLTT